MTSARTRQRAADETVAVGVIVLTSPDGDTAAHTSFTDRLVGDVRPELERSLDARWQFHREEPGSLADSEARRPSVFLDRAVHQLVEGSYDLVVVVTDVPLTSSREKHVPGLASPLGRTVCLSTRVLRRAGRDEPVWSLDADAVRWNAATLLLHLIGHVLGARHGHGGGVMDPFRFDPERRDVPSFDADVRRYFHSIATGVSETETVARGVLRRAWFYVTNTARNAGTVFRALADSRGPLLPLSLPKLSTAALAPTLVIVFSAEAWDVGFHMSNATAAAFAVVSIVAAALYLLFSQNLSFPQERHRRITEHAALVNVTVFLVLVSAMAGLFALVGGVVLLIQFVVFPPNLMSNWPSLEDPTVGVVDMVRTAAFISTVGVLSGALAGGLENRAIVRHLALFHDRP